jgi:prevent-host-death family protein
VKLANIGKTTTLESKMSEITVASTEFQNRAGLYMEQSAKSPVFITKHSRPVRVLIDIDEYERLKARDTRKAYYAHEIPDDWKGALESATFDHLDPSWDHLADKPKP